LFWSGEIMRDSLICTVFTAHPLLVLIWTNNWCSNLSCDWSWWPRVLIWLTLSMAVIWTSYPANVCLLYLSGRPIISPGSTKRVGPIVRPITPKSSVPTVSAFDRIEDSDDEEDLVPDAKNDTAYLAPNGAIVSIRSLCYSEQVIPICLLVPLELYLSIAWILWLEDLHILSFV